MKFELVKLPYLNNALEPVISSNTISFHYGKHHNGYVQKLNELIENSQFSTMTLTEIMTTSHQTPPFTPIFNNAAQVWNHDFYWKSMAPYKTSSLDPTKSLAKLIDKKFGTFEKFVTDFVAKGVGAFGSSWAWLIITKDHELEIFTTSNADSPILHSKKPLFTIDLWEHSYYLDYQNRRADYIKASLENLVNWSFAEKNLESH